MSAEQPRDLMAALQASLGLPPRSCTGADDCTAPLHVHGCYADLNGPCDNPGDHEGLPTFADTCCGTCPLGTCYVDRMTGA